ncbi:MAG: hypothetical protein QOF61_2233, partial [Acidobacteriota bacterium]|nr:hypothetical protein [Acidobacteriota bacterium]
FNSTVIAALGLSAAIPTSAQKRRTTTRKQTVAQTSTEPAAAKKNQRAADDTVSPPTGASSGVEASPPVKKNADARAAAQSNEPATANGVDAKKNADGVRYVYEFSQPDFDVRRVRIEHDAAGHGQITFERKNEEKPLTEPLEITPTAFARIVSAWEALKFLDSDASYQADKHFANMGTIRLSMKRGARERATEFDWTNNEQAASLKREYQRLTDQELFVFDIDIARQYQPSETVRILKRLEILLDHDEISDKSALAPLLNDLTTDERIPLIARNQAARLLKKIEKETK